VVCSGNYKPPFLGEKRVDVELRGGEREDVGSDVLQGPASPESTPH
jgi:hypothetical protein